ncbi:MAG: DUF4174 domain-containing protein [Candidatus Synoicihabitans palmerolidicus]|nr:DUF4174 domain-containing protein [Candidatus Synoicihabitans palmerolidicus]
MCTSAHNDLPDVSGSRWKARVLVVDAPSYQDPKYEEQAALWIATWEAINARDLVVRAQFGPNAFRLRLIGKDG